MRKSLFIIFIFALGFAGCAQKNLTWTPTQAEWQLMTPTERNDWYRAEIDARQSASSQRRMEMESGYGRIYQTSPPSNQGNSTYWQEQQAQQQYYDRVRREPSESIRRIYGNTQTIVKPPM